MDTLVPGSVSEAALRNLGQVNQQNRTAYQRLSKEPIVSRVVAEDDVLRNEARDYAIFPVLLPSGREVMPPPNTSWRYTKEKFAELIADNRIWFGKEGDSRPAYKRFLSEVSDSIPAETIWMHGDAGHNDAAKKELRALFDEQAPFDTPKPVKLLERILSVGTGPGGDEIVLDFFAGSGTTAHATFRLNAADGGKRRFILVQLPERLDPSNKDQAEAAKFCEAISRPKTIAEITKERIRRSARVVLQEAGGIVQMDTGFRSFKLDTSNIRAWNPELANLEQSLFAHQDHILDERSEPDVLYELLLKLGIDLCIRIEQRNVLGKAVHAVGGGVLMACLATSIAATEVEAVALGIVNWHKELAPAGDTTCVFRDSAFADDVAKTNMAAILNQHGIQNVRSL